MDLLPPSLVHGAQSGVSAIHTRRRWWGLTDET
jgi:hypothetical protein